MLDGQQKDPELVTALERSQEYWCTCTSYLQLVYTSCPLRLWCLIALSAISLSIYMSIGHLNDFYTPVRKTGCIMLQELYGRASGQAYARWFPLNIVKGISFILTKFGTQKHQGKWKTQVRTGWPWRLDLIFKVTEVILGYEIWKKVSAQYLKKYRTNPHQIWCTCAAGRGKFWTLWPWPFF